MNDLNANTLSQAVEMIRGTCVSMGIEIKGKSGNENVKNLVAISEKHDKALSHSLEDAIKLVKKYKFVKFDESVDLAINLDVDPGMLKKIFE